MNYLGLPERFSAWKLPGHEVPRSLSSRPPGLIRWALRRFFRRFLSDWISARLFIFPIR